MLKSANAEVGAEAASSLQIADSHLPSFASSGEGTRIAAVVVTYNRRALLKDCLNALLRQTRPLDSIIVVDNASTDGTPDMISGEYAGRVELIANQNNIGAPGAFAQGIQRAYEAGYAWFWLMDDDCIAERDGLEHLLRPASRNSLALYGPRVLDPETGDDAWYRWDGRTPGSVVAVSAAAWGGLLVPSRIVALIGLPRADIFINGDDVEYCLRARVKGCRTYVVYDSVARHPAPMFVRRGRIGAHHLIVYPRFRSTDRAYYYLRNTILLMRDYRRPCAALPLLRAARDMVCLLLSGTIPLAVLAKAVKDGFAMPLTSR